MPPIMIIKPQIYIVFFLPNTITELKVNIVFVSSKHLYSCYKII